MFFNKVKSIENNIEKYFDNILRASLIFEQGIKEYLGNKLDEFEQRTKEIQKLESDTDELRRDIKYMLYKELLIPDSRGDVLGLLETIDNVIDTSQKVMVRFSIEKPLIWEELFEDFIELTAASTRCVSELICASRAFFKDISNVADFLTKVHFWEHEADKIEEKIMRKTFSGDFTDKLSLKVHIRYFAECISQIADEAEAVAERLEIYTIKRSM